MRNIRLTESDLVRLVKRIVEENERDTMESGINDVMRFGYDMMDRYAPEGIRNSKQYSKAIDQLESDFKYTIRNLRGNTGQSNNDEEY